MMQQPSSVFQGGWTLHTDVASGRQYYHNSNTGQSAWATALPKAQATAPAATDAGASATAPAVEKAAPYGPAGRGSSPGEHGKGPYSEAAAPSEAVAGETAKAGINGSTAAPAVATPAPATLSGGGENGSGQSAAQLAAQLAAAAASATAAGVPPAPAAPQYQPVVAYGEYAGVPSTPQFAPVVADAGDPSTKQYAPVVADAGEPGAKQYAAVVADAGMPGPPQYPAAVAAAGVALPYGALPYGAPQDGTLGAIPQYAALGQPGMAGVSYPGGVAAYSPEQYYALQQQQAMLAAQYSQYYAAVAVASAGGLPGAPGAAAPGQPTTAWITNRLIDREKARIEKNYAEADKMRSLLREQGVQVDDHLRSWTAKDGRSGARPNHNDSHEPEG